MIKKALFFFCFLFLILSLILGWTVRHYKDKSRYPFKVCFAINQDLFDEKLLKEPPSWVLDQIHRDLEMYQTRGIRKEDLDRVFYSSQRESLNLVRFTIKDRNLSFSLSEKNLDFRPFRHILASLKKINELVELPDVDFLVSLQDSLDEDVKAPIFVYAKPESISSLILMPDFKALTGYPGLRREIERANQSFPWEQKVEKAFWRGTSTGGWLTALQWTQFPRVRLALLSLEHSEILDAKITALAQADEDVLPLAKAKGVLGKKKTQKQHLKFKYLVDVDGNSCSFERYFWSLLSNSVVLKQMTPNIQWYYSALKPYQHFIPVEQDLSDLMDQIQWALTNDDKARQIAEEATRFIQEELSLEDTFVYMVHLLREYANISFRINGE